MGHSQHHCVDVYNPNLTFCGYLLMWFWPQYAKYDREDIWKMTLPCRSTPICWRINFNLKLCGYLWMCFRHIPTPSYAKYDREDIGRWLSPVHHCLWDLHRHSANCVYPRYHISSYVDCGQDSSLMLDRPVEMLLLMAAVIMYTSNVTYSGRWNTSLVLNNLWRRCSSRWT